MRVSGDASHDSHMGLKMALRTVFAVFLSLLFGQPAFADSIIGPAWKLWNPGMLTGEISLWWDATDASTITVATGVSDWKDKASGLHAVQAVAADQPLQNATGINNKNTLSFTTAAPMALATTSGNSIFGASFSVIYVSQLNATGAFLDVVSANTGIASPGPDLAFNNLSPAALWDSNRFTEGQASTLTTVINVPHYEEWTSALGVSGTTLVVIPYLDGTVASSLTATGFPASPTYTGIVIGTNSGSDANYLLGEVIVTTGVLPAAERKQIENYLHAKWAI